MRREEDLLQEVLCIRRVAEQAECDAVEPTRVRPVELFERPQIALAATLDERPLVRSAGCGRTRGRRMNRDLRRRHARFALPGPVPCSTITVSLVFRSFVLAGPHPAPPSPRLRRDPP